MSAWRGCVARAATKTDLVAPNLLRYVVESLYNAEAQFLPLLIFVDDNIFNMPHQAEIVYAVAPNEKTSEESARAHTDDDNKLQGLVTTPHTNETNAQFPLHDHTARPHHFALPVAHHQYVVLVPALRHPIVALRPRGLRDVADGREDPEHIEHARFVVGALQGPHGVVFRESGDDGGGDEGGGEEGAVGGVRHVFVAGGGGW